MSKNTKHRHYKAYLRLMAEEDKLEQIQRNLGYRELEKPVHYGYNAYFVLREDVARREDAYIFQHIIDNYTTETWSKTPEFYIKRKRYYEDRRPTFKTISEREYEMLDVRLTKHFYHDSSKDRKSWDGSVYKYYSCGIPPYYLVMEVKKSYLTHEKVIDSELECQLSFIGDKLSQMRDTMPLYNNRGLSAFRKGLVKNERNYNKQRLRQNLKTQILSDDGIWEDWSRSSNMNGDPYQFDYKTRNNAKWLWW